MTSRALLQMSTIAKISVHGKLNRTSISSATPHNLRRTGLALISRNSNIATSRARLTHVQVHASQSPNPFGSGGGGNSGNDESTSLISDLALPAGGLLLLLLAGPIFGGATAVFGLPLIITGLAAAFGVLDTIAGIFGTTPLVAAAVVASTSLGILLIPAFLKFGFIALAGYFVANLLFGGGREDSDVTSGSGGGPSSYYNQNGSGSSEKSNSYSSNKGRNEFDARNVTIDVEAETIDD
jgi:hypothetical protein